MKSHLALVWLPRVAAATTLMLAQNDSPTPAFCATSSLLLVFPAGFSANLCALCGEDLTAENAEGHRGLVMSSFPGRSTPPTRHEQLATREEGNIITIEVLILSQHDSMPTRGRPGALI